MFEATKNVPIGNYLINKIVPTEKRRRGYKLVIFFFTLLIYTCYHISRKPISVVKSELHHNNCSDVANREHKTINSNNDTFCDWKPFNESDWASLMANLDLVYLLAYAFTMFISGHIAERVNIRYFLSAGMILCGLSTSLFGLGFYLEIHVYYYYIIVQIIAGIFQATGWPSVVACMGNWFGKSKRGFFMGLWNCHTSLGNIIGSVVAGIFVEYAWGLSFIVPGAIIASMGIVVFLFLTPYPEDVGCRQSKTQNGPFGQTMHSAVIIVYPGGESQSGSLESSCNTVADSINREEDLLVPKVHGNVPFLRALLIPGVIEYSLCLFFAKLVSYTFLFWLPSYIKSTSSFTASQSADLSAIMDFGGIIGGIIAGVISDWTGSSAITCVGMLILCIPYLYIYFLYGTTSMGACIGLLVMLGILANGPYALITTAVSADLGTHETLKGNARAVATVTAIIDGTGSLGAALGPLLTGLLLPYGWKYVFIMLMVATGLAALLLSRRLYKEIVILCVERKRKRIEKLCMDKDYA